MARHCLQRKQNYLFELRDTLVELEEVTKAQDAELVAMQANPDVDSFAIRAKDDL
ncbi:UNVERIFIED_ORG: hypothetical protein [Escherichia phage CMSTMSU]